MSKALDDATPKEWNEVTRTYLNETVSIKNKPSAVENPPHYNQGKIECIDYIADSLGDNVIYYYDASIKKYLHRWQYKNQVEDLRKARWYLDKLIAHITKP